jgi:hypothetical protein
MRFTEGHKKLHALIDGGLTIAAFARAADIKYGAARNLVAGAMPKVPVAASIERAYSIPLTDWSTSTREDPAITDTMLDNV